MDFKRQEMKISIDGMGGLCSSHTADNIEDGENYFESEFKTPEQVDAQVIWSVFAQVPGDYILKFRHGYPTDDICGKYPTVIRLAVVIEGGKLQVRDLFELMDWNKECLAEQEIDIADGIYHITVCTAMPKSGIVGDDQVILLYLNRLEKMPLIVHNGVPQLIP